MKTRLLRFVLSGILSSIMMVSNAQLQEQKIYPTSLQRAVNFGEDLLVKDNTLFVTDPEFKKDDPVNNSYCQEGYGAVSIYKKLANNWYFFQLFKHDPNTGIENKFGRNISYKNNVFIASSEREDYNSSTKRAGAIYVYKRSWSGEDFTRIAKLYSPFPETDNEFSSNGLATNGQHIVVYDNQRNLLYLFEIQGDNVVYITNTTVSSSKVIGITDENVVVLSGGLNGNTHLFKIQNNTLQPILSGFISPQFNTGLTGDASVDGNTIAYGAYSDKYIPSEGWGKEYYIKVLKLKNSQVDTVEYISFPTYANFGGQLLDISIHENKGIAVSFLSNQTTSFKHRAFLLKYINGLYQLADAARLNYDNNATDGGKYGEGVAYDGTDFFVSDYGDWRHTLTNQTSPCNNKAPSGSLYIYRENNPIQASAGNSQKLVSNLGSEGSAQALGYSTATNGNWAFSGAPSDDDVSNSSGSVTVMKKEAGQWEFFKKIYSPLGDDYANFGQAIDADANSLVVGASQTDRDGYYNVGQVYIYDIYDIENGYTNTTIIECPDKVHNQYFGASVSIDGNVLAIGAPGDDTKATDAGIIYMYLKQNNKWALHTKFYGVGGEANDNFGYAIDLKLPVMIVGAPYADNDAGINAGEILLYNISQYGSPAFRDRFWPTTNRNNQNLGKSVAISGEYAVAGCPNYSNNKGYVQTYKIKDNISHRWKIDSKIYGDNIDNSRFGYSVALVGDKMLVGAVGQSKVFRYQRQGSSWIKKGAIQNTDSYYFGHNFDLSGDQVIIGCPYADQYLGETYLVNFSNMSGARSGNEELSETGTLGDNVAIYPNPVSGGLVNINFIGEVLKVTAYNTIGYEIGALSVENNQINISHLSEGIYILKIETTEGSFTKKLLIE